jgi:NAD(P)-dependent dehydrogenase (short-subunit alcohol dehydrogenase family)
MVCTALQGLRQRFARTSIRVTDLRPGLVDTPMTVGFRKGPLWAAAGDVGAGIVKHIDRGSAVVYLPGYWRPIMLVIRHLPEFVFRRMRF